ncbi:hypothetical protein ABVK25_003934 [Lepraria finkii]|uniref:Gem-associated protein 5 TPR domain-containing protein n=1 Tax=Lepraria finkii TaxID=1340010 RepID=A0ABR4BD91_9LECA
MSAGQLARHRSSSSGTRPSLRDNRSATPIDPRTTNVDFDPCAATGSTFLFAQGSSIICLQHDTLAVERKFEMHREKVLLIAVDNVSETGAGRLVFSYDVGGTVFVWDVFTGLDVTKFYSYEPIGVAAWMKNGNVVFGNPQGTVVIFTPSHNEHKSARTIYDPITAIAPAWDCQTYAIGYLNGSILIASIEPTIDPKQDAKFTILHTLTTARAPSPIVNLAWHASSTKQKSDMLASQTMDGDLRVWSVAKPPTAEMPKTIRILKRMDNVEPGRHWCSWSKNGRVLQFSDSETWSWDVRTKRVACEPVPTVDGVRGLACYGQQATLFTLGPNSTVQQYDTSPPALVKTIQYNPMLPPAVANSNSAQPQFIPGAAPPRPSSRSDAARGPVTLSTIQSTTNEMNAIDHARQLREEMGSPISSTSRTDTMSSRSSNRQRWPRHIPSIASRAQSGVSGTTFSTVSPSMVGRDSLFSGDTSIYQSSASIASSGRRSKGSRLRQEVLRSPENQYIDLFPRTRMRLTNVAYQHTEPIDQETMTPDDCRRRMLELVFGWNDDIEPLIRDELNHHQAGSHSAVLLAKWLGDVDSDMMAAAISSGNVSSSDWMVLALSSMGGSGSMGKMGQAFVQRLLSQGEYHIGSTILLGMGDREDAVEVYVSRSYYMEAILLTCLIFPDDWQRQAHLVRRWGEFVVENSQQHLAIRCFACTGVEGPVPWTSPSPRPIDTPGQTPSSISSMLSPPVSPPPMRMTAKNSALKLVTQFDRSAPAFKFPGLASTERTPTNGPGVTPIAESAVSPGGATPGGFSSRRNVNNLASRTITLGGFNKNRLPSIGETPVDVNLPRPSQLPTPDNSGSDLEKEKEIQFRAQAAEGKKETPEAPPLLLTSARYDPGSARNSPMTAVPQTTVRTTVLPNPSQDSFISFQERSRDRNGSRDRKPDGLHIRMPSQNQIVHEHYISTAKEQRNSHAMNSLLSAGLSTGRSDTKSPSTSGHSMSSAKSPSISGRSTDNYISSLEAAGYHRKQKGSSRKRTESREGREHKSRSKGRNHEKSVEDRGRGERRYIRPAKRSPSSPKPMSPETYIEPSTGESLNGQLAGIYSPVVSEGRSLREEPRTVTKLRSCSKASENSYRTVRHMSPDNFLGIDTSFTRSKASSRQPSPSAFLDPNGRGRSKSKQGGSIERSPSSPLPMTMSPQSKHYQASDEEDDPLRIVEANRQRLRSRHRSSSRKPHERGTSSRRDRSSDRRRAHDEYNIRVRENDEPRSAVELRRASGDLMLPPVEQPKLQRKKSERSQRKELAARELEARRESLLRNVDAPQILRPDELNSARPNFNRSQTDLSNAPVSWNPIMPQQQYQSFPSTTSAMGNGDIISRAASTGPYGLPATPRAMRHPRYDNKANEIPAVPEIPDTIQPLPETYYTGQPMHEPPRSVSAPIPEQQQHPPMPAELPMHPAFHKGLRPTKRSNFSPLGEIGAHRRKPSGDNSQSMTYSPVTASIDETLHGAAEPSIIVVEEPPLLPELQHLSMVPPPPPPPPPAPFSNRHDPESSSLSSSSGVGVIQMVLHNEPGDENNAVEVPPPPPLHPENARSPPMETTGSPPPGSMSQSSSNHRRGRSENFKNGINFKGITDRLRSSSRGRMTKSPEQNINNTPSAYESVPPLYF